VTHLSTNLVFSVLPAPDSPETMMDWLIFSTFMSLYALSAEEPHTQTLPSDYSARLRGHKRDPNNQADVKLQSLTSSKFPGRIRRPRARGQIKNYNAAGSHFHPDGLHLAHSQCIVGRNICHICHILTKQKQCHVLKNQLKSDRFASSLQHKD